MIKSETPKDIMSIAVDDVWKLVKDEEGCTLPKPKVRLAYVKMLYDVLGLTLTPDVALASIAMKQAQLCIAPAGGGKTTWEQVVAVAYKLLFPYPVRPSRKVPGGKILCLVYNRHNIADVVHRHEQIVSRLQLAKIDGLKLDNEINACTMHSFCDFIRKRYVAKLNMVGFNLMDDAQSIATMRRSATIIAKKKNGKQVTDVDVSNLLSFYMLCKETMRSVWESTECDKFEDLQMDEGYVEEIFHQYESSKRLAHRYDYVDMLTSVCSLLESDQRVLAEVQRYYSVVMADEVQDFTPIMWKILKLLVSNGTPLTCIGDEDQCIYHFRGASMKDMLGFSQSFEGGKVYNLLLNRRCCDNILKEANSVISENTLRFDKDLIGTKQGGTIEAVKYSSVEGQILNVVGRLKNMSAVELESTVCCFREQKHAKLLIDFLESEKIDFHSIQGLTPFSYELYHHVIDVLNALELPYDRDVILNLYKVLPCSKEQFAQIIGYDVTKKRFKSSDVTKRHFAEYDYGEIMQRRLFPETLLQLCEISKGIKDTPMKDYMGTIFELLDKYLWKYRKSQKGEDELDGIFEKRVKDLFNSSKPFPKFFESYTRRRNVCRSYNESKLGVAVSTFHGLKGLEYKNVFALFMDDTIFPNFGLIESKHYSGETELELKESETRLWYVTTTRAIENLVMYYPANNPSKYVQDFLDRDSGIYVRPRSTGAASTEVISDLGETDFKLEEVNGFDDDFSDDFSDDFLEGVPASSTDVAGQEDDLDDFDGDEFEPVPVSVAGEPVPVASEPVPVSVTSEPAQNKVDEIAEEPEYAGTEETEQAIVARQEWNDSSAQNMVAEVDRKEEGISEGLKIDNMESRKFTRNRDFLTNLIANL